MPDDANGVYSLPDGYLAVTGQTIQPSQHNPPLRDLGAAMTARLSRSGAAPMTGQFKNIDGDAGSPAITFNSAQTTGFYLDGDGNIAVTIGGQQVAKFTASGAVIGGKFIGEIFDWTGSTPPPLCVLPYGQTLLRSAYPDLWTFAQNEIAAGNLLYNNGDGSTTFGIPDARGRARAAADNMGGSAAGLLTSLTMVPNGTTLGAKGGTQSRAIAVANLPPYTPMGTIENGYITINHNAQAAVYNSASGTGMVSGSYVTAATITASQAPSYFYGSPQGGQSVPFVLMPPTIIANCALFAGA